LAGGNLVGVVAAGDCGRGGVGWGAHDWMRAMVDGADAVEVAADGVPELWV